jgi:XTP/dITP diphosphohydrolase
LELVLASRNPHKLGELSSLLEPNRLSPLPPDVELPPETGATFAENALSKARAAAYATRKEALGEDSGIVVSALGGRPGVRSARYAGHDADDRQNLLKLLTETREANDRRAAYVSALAFASPNGEEKLFEARCEGRLAHQPSGSGGFGYDPIFIPDEGPEGDVTMASLTADQKNEISHRGRAARLLMRWLSSKP